MAGTEAVELLGISTKRLLEVCAGAPTEALSVLEHHAGDAKCLEGVPAVTLLDAGIRSVRCQVYCLCHYLLAFAVL